MRNIRQSIIRASTRKRLNLSMKNTIKELNVIIHEANAIQTIQGLKLMIKFETRIIKAFVNLKITSNFIF